MPILPEELNYASTHEWVIVENGTVATVGISEFAQDQLGDIVFLELPEPGTKVEAGQPCATVESVKTASDIHSPVTGTVVEYNENSVDEPDTVNEAPYEAWLFKIEMNNRDEINQLLSFDDYKYLIKDE